MKQGTQAQTNPAVDRFINKATSWKEEFEKMREIALDCHLTEELKWGKPCYTLDGSIIFIIGGFKEHCGLLFFKGALMKDEKGILHKPGENSNAGRRTEFTSLSEIARNASTLKAYIGEAIEIEKSGAKPPPRSKELEIPAELQDKFEAKPAFKKAFYALTPGRQRAYILFFSSAKQSATRVTRIEKYVKQILAGKGMMDE
ncbi:MAG TPA: YdeI/OmpD-associated family protein [Planktothrix sp.]